MGGSNGEPGYRQAVLGFGLLPWWIAEDICMQFWRPIASLSPALDDALWGGWPWLMHLHSLAWFAGVIVLASLFYRRLLGPTWVARLARCSTRSTIIQNFKGRPLPRRIRLLAEDKRAAVLILARGLARMLVYGPRKSS